MKNKLVWFVIVMFMFAITIPAFAITQNNERELQQATPGTRKANLGNLIRAKYATGVFFMTTSATAIDLFQEPSGDTGYIRKFLGTAAETSTLGDGREGQEITFALTHIGGGGVTSAPSWTVTPSTSSGFRAFVLSGLGQNITLKYIDDTVGWVAVGMATSDNGVMTLPNGSEDPGYK